MKHMSIRSLTLKFLSKNARYQSEQYYQMFDCTLRNKIGNTDFNSNNYCYIPVECVARKPFLCTDPSDLKTTYI